MTQRDDEFGRHLGTLWKTAVAGLDTMREVLVRSTQSGRLRVDIALLNRERAQLLETLGEIVVGLIDDGLWDEAPESVRQAVERIKDVEAQIKTDSIKVSDNAFGAPRGYEPEAASDYGEPDDADGAFDHPAPAPRRRGPRVVPPPQGGRAEAPRTTIRSHPLPAGRTTDGTTRPRPPRPRRRPRS